MAKLEKNSKWDSDEKDKGIKKIKTTEFICPKCKSKKVIVVNTVINKQLRITHTCKCKNKYCLDFEKEFCLYLNLAKNYGDKL